MREANVLKVVVVVLLYYNPDSGTIHYENFSIFQMTVFADITFRSNSKLYCFSD